MRESAATMRPQLAAAAAVAVAVELSADTRPSFSPNGSSFVQYPAKWNIPFPRERSLQHPLATPLPSPVPSPWNNCDHFPHAVLHHLRQRLSANTRRAEGSRTIRRYLIPWLSTSWMFMVAHLVSPECSCRYVRANSNRVTSIAMCARSSHFPRRFPLRFAFGKLDRDTCSPRKVLKISLLLLDRFEREKEREFTLIL